MFMQKNKVKGICIIIPTLYSGGAEKQSVFLAETLRKHFPTYLIVLHPEMIEEKFKEKIKNINIVKLEGNYFKKGVSLYRFMKKHGINYIFSYLLSGNFYNGFIGGLTRVPHRIGGIRNAELAPKKILFEKILHNFLLHQTISNSYSAKHKLKLLGFKEEKFHIIHNAFELKTNIIERNNEGVVKILSVARFVPQKDYFTALEAIKILKGKLNLKTNPFQYLLIGYGQLEQEIRNKVEELELSDVVQIIINPENLFEYFKKSDIFLSTSLFEGMSNSVMEALSYSLPVVTTDAGDMEYLVRDGHNGYLCEFKNPNQIADNLEKIIVNSKKRATMGRNSYSLLKDNFSLEIFEKKYLDFITQAKK
jgi:glycosyltransferase involved in cell wall biosynthesis